MAACWLILAAASVPVHAQPAGDPSLRRHELVVSSGPIWSAGYGIGESLAQLRSNATGAQPAPFTLLGVTSSIEPLAGMEANLGYAITPSLVVEGGGWFARANIAVELSRDAEAAPRSIDGEKLHQLVLSGGVVWRLPWSFGPRAAPFVTGGAGYLRQLHEERTLVETGRIVYLGAGVRYFIAGGHGVGRSVGLRGDVRATWRSPGIDFEDKTRAFPTITVLVFAGF
ncbi:MAG: hypothetical protein ACRD2A_14030 [Vicinamibacterales bacterium]